MKFEVVGMTKDFRYAVISNGKEFYVLNEGKWNGEKFSSCWRCENILGHYEEEFDAREYEITPVVHYNEVEDEFEIVDYEIN